MGESIPVKVTLGGPIREGTIGPLVDAMMGDGLFAGGDESACEASHLEAAIRAAATRGEVVSFDNYAASYGSADETEAVCAEHGIAYDCRCDGKYEYPGHWTSFRPGASPETTEGCCDNDGSPYVLVAAVLKALQQPDAAAAVEAVRALCVMPPPLAPVAIIK